jgi:hypothetical protein
VFQVRLYTKDNCYIISAITIAGTDLSLVYSIDEAFLLA